MKTIRQHLLPFIVIGLVLSLSFGILILAKIKQHPIASKKVDKLETEKTNYEMPRFYPSVKIGS